MYENEVTKLLEFGINRRKKEIEIVKKELSLLHSMLETTGKHNNTSVEEGLNMDWECENSGEIPKIEDYLSCESNSDPFKIGSIEKASKEVINKPKRLSWSDEALTAEGSTEYSIHSIPGLGSSLKIQKTRTTLNFNSMESDENNENAEEGLNLSDGVLEDEEKRSDQGLVNPFLQSPSEYTTDSSTNSSGQEKKSILRDSLGYDRIYYSRTISDKANKDERVKNEIMLENQCKSRENNQEQEKVQEIEDLSCHVKDTKNKVKYIKAYKDLLKIKQMLLNEKDEIDKQLEKL